MVIHGLLDTCLDQLALVFICLKWCSVCGFENVLKRCLVWATLVTILYSNVLQKVFVFFKKMFQGFLKVCFESVCEMWFEKKASVLFFKLANDQELSTPNFSKIIATF